MGLISKMPIDGLTLVSAHGIGSWEGFGDRWSPNPSPFYP
jgi:hypothetical protein